MCIYMYIYIYGPCNAGYILLVFNYDQYVFVDYLLIYTNFSDPLPCENVLMY